MFLHVDISLLSKLLMSTRDLPAGTYNVMRSVALFSDLSKLKSVFDAMCIYFAGRYIKKRLT